MSDNVCQIIKDAVAEQIASEVDEMIAKEIAKFERILIDRKDEYIAQIMKGIRFAHEYDPMRMSDNYRILFENIVRVEK